MPLTRSELQYASLLEQKADWSAQNNALKVQYYNYVASYGDRYAAVAAQDAGASTLAGQTDDWFFKDQARAIYGVTVSQPLANLVAERLLDADDQSRVAAGGADLGYSAVLGDHACAYSAVCVGVYAWDETVPVQLLGAAAWTQLLTTGLLGTAGVFGTVLLASAAPLTANYGLAGAAGAQAQGVLSTAQQWGIGWARAVATATVEALTYGAPTDGTGPVVNAGLVHLTATGAEFAGAPGGVGDIFVTGGCSATVAQAMTGSTLFALAGSSAVTVTGSGNDVFSFGCGDAISVTGSGNTVYAGPGSSSVAISGYVNTVRGGQGCATVTLSAVNTAADIVIGGAGSMNLVSRAPVTQFIGGSGTACLDMVGDASSVLLGSGTTTGSIAGGGIALETGSGTAVLSLSGSTETVVTGSGRACLTYTGSGSQFLQGDPSGSASFSLTGTGDTVYGGDCVTMTGTGMAAYGRAAGLTGFAGQAFSGVLNAMDGFAGDPVIASAMAADAPYAVGAAPAPAPAAGCCPSSCGSAAAPVRFITMNTDSSAVYDDTRYEVVSITGSNNSSFGSAAGRWVTIQSGSNNAVWGSAGNNVYVSHGTNNVLEYIDYPAGNPDPSQPAQAAVQVNLGTGLASNGHGGTDVICGFNWVEAGSGSTLLGGVADARLTVLGDHGFLRSGLGNDTLYASGSGSTLEATAGSDLLHTGGTDNSYVFGDHAAVPLQTEIRQDFVGVTGTMSFLSGASPSSLWFAADAAGDLLVEVLGTRQVVTVDGWFSAGTQLAAITTPTGTLGNAAINAMAAAMANYQSAHAGFDPHAAGQMPSDGGLAAALSAWH